MKISYDKEVDAVSVTLRKGVVSRTVEISPEIMMDYDIDGNPLYIEILGASDKLGKKDLSHITIGSVQVPFAVTA